MGIEIERKFLVKKEIWATVEKPKGEQFRQGYLVNTKEKTVRVRQTTSQGFLTIKGKSEGASRAEFEYEIPHNEAGELLDKFAENELSKVRYTLKNRGDIWEVDEFFGENQGLLVAEIELNSEDQLFDIPEWLDNEVTDDSRYFNANLATDPFSKWESD